MKDFFSNGSKITCGMGEIVVRADCMGNVPWTAAWALSGYIREPEHYGYRTSVGMGRSESEKTD